VDHRVVYPLQRGEIAVVQSPNDPRDATPPPGPVGKPDADDSLTGLVTSPVAAEPVGYGRSFRSSRPGFQS